METKTQRWEAIVGLLTGGSLVSGVGGLRWAGWAEAWSAKHG